MTLPPINKRPAAKTPAPPTPAAKETNTLIPSGSPQLNQIPLHQESLLYLQRTIGNQSTARLIAPRIQRDLDFDNTQWHDGKSVKPLTSGVNPVFGIDNLVIKGVQSGGAQQQFASQVYGGLVEAPRTRAVPVDSVEGRAIVYFLTRKSSDRGDDRSAKRRNDRRAK